VAALDWATWHPNIRPTRCHVSQYNSPTYNQSTIAMSPASRLPHRQVPRHCTVTTSACTDVQSACTDCPVSVPFFFPVWRFEQIVITLGPDVCLRRNELRWVHDDESYKPICFEAILRTLIFELKFEPWSRF
jgi:hypothetical protein